MDSKELANRVKKYRTSKGWTRAKLAEKANLEPRTISRIELCEGQDIKVSTLLKIALALDITPNDLLLHELIQTDKLDDDVVYAMFKVLTSEQRAKVYDYICYITK